MTFYYFLAWVVLCIFVGIIARSRGRDVVVWFLISAVISPLFGYILVMSITNLVKEERYRDKILSEKSRIQDEEDRHKELLKAISELHSELHKNSELHTNYCSTSAEKIKK